MDREELFNSVNDEMKEKLKACKSEQEMMEVLADNDMEALDDDLLEAAAGGSCCAGGAAKGPKCAVNCNCD